MFKINYEVPKFKCITCGEEKPEVDFYTQAYVGTRTAQCRCCINIKRSVVRSKAKHGKFISKERQRGMEEPDFTLHDWKAAMLYFRGSCVYCGEPEVRTKKGRFDREHLIPISRGGKTDKKNIVPSCPRCNRSRGNKKLFVWFREQPFYNKEREDKIRNWIGADKCVSEEA